MEIMISRPIEERLGKLAEYFPAIGIIGPRQVGKTTLVKEFIKKIGKKSIYLDMELSTDADKLKDPEIFLKQNQDHCVVIDEIQNKPELFPLLRALIDQNRVPLRFIILGSASPQLLKQSSESLAGRISYLLLNPFNYAEINGIKSLEDHHFWGGFPDAILAGKREVASNWTDNFIRTYTERDLPLFGLNVEPNTIRRLWEMISWNNGNLLNLNSIGKSLGLNYHTVNHYINFFENTYLVRRLQPFHFNLKKRLVKSPKVYLTDTGILHRLLRISDYNQLLGHTSIGSSWEAYVINQIFSLKSDDFDLYFYQTHNGAEVDLVFVKALIPIATVEIKFTSTPHPAKGLINCTEDLKTDKNFIVTPFSDDYPAKENIQVCSLPVFLEKYLPEIK
jgi:predicted AAA+ superfamily ATPase